MKKNVLALSIAAMVGGLGFAGAASAALAVNESGEGHILTVPYYTAQNGNMTVFHLTNSDDTNGKAVKVRFRGASNSDDVLDFQVFLSPGDVWTAAVTKGADGKAQLQTADKTCTLPMDLQEGKAVPFVTDRLTKKGWTDADKAAQTLEGYIEILNMADIASFGSDDYNADKSAKSFYGAIKHKSGVAPCTTAILEDTLNWEQVVLSTTASSKQWKVGASSADPTQAVDTDGNGWKDVGLRAPTGTLSAQWYIMNVEQTTTYSGAASAIVATPQADVRVVYSPQKTGKASLLSADPLLTAMASGAYIIEPQFYDVPDLSTPYVKAGAVAQTDAIAQAELLTNAIKRVSVSNQFATAAGVKAKTDWVFSMPTRRYTVAANYATSAKVEDYNQTASVLINSATTAAAARAAYRVHSDVGVTTTANANAFTAGTNTSVNDAGQICLEAKSSTFWDREEQSKKDGAVFSPGTPLKTKLCGEVSVLSFSDDASAVGAVLARQNVKAPYTNGWGTVSFGTAATDGVPMLGAAFIKLNNGSAAPGVSGNYGITWPHTFKNAQ